MAADRNCSNHPDKPAIGKCVLCGKDICADCRQLLGYFCSRECKERSLATIDRQEIHERERQHEAMTSMMKAAKIIVGLVFVAALAFGAFIVWKTFFNPAGKLAWRVEFENPCGDVKVLGSDASKIVVKAWNKILSISPDSGSTISSCEIPGYGISSENDEIILPDKIIISANDRISAYDFSGSQLWERKFPGKRPGMHKAGDGIVVAVLSPVLDYEDAEAVKNAAPAETKALSADNGNEIWSSASDRKAAPASVIASGEGFFATQSYVPEESPDAMRMSITLHNARTGEEKFRIKTGYVASSKILDGKFIFETDNSLNAVSLSDGSRLWSVKGASAFGNELTLVAPGRTLVQSDDRLLCMDDVAKASIWELATSYIEGDVLADAGRIFLTYHEVAQGEPEKSEPAGEDLPATTEDMKGRNILQETMAGSKKLPKSNAIFACLNADDGKEIWRVSKAPGDSVLCDGRILKIHDTAMSSIMALSPEMGETIISAYDIRSGKHIFSARHKLGISGPYVSNGGFLAGVVFSREQTSMKLSFDEGQYGKDGNIVGLAAFRLR